MPMEYHCSICGHTWNSHHGDERRPNVCVKCHRQNWFWNPGMPISHAPDNIIENFIANIVVEFLGDKKSKIVNRTTLDQILVERIPGWGKIYKSRRGRVLKRYLMKIDPTLFLSETGNKKIFYRL